MDIRKKCSGCDEVDAAEVTSNELNITGLSDVDKDVVRELVGASFDAGVWYARFISGVPKWASDLAHTKYREMKVRRQAILKQLGISGGNQDG